MKRFEQYRITKDRTLDAINPSDSPFKKGSKEADNAYLSELTQQIDGLQELLFAEQKRKVLLVLQGLDTSGKDGTVRDVFAHTSPLGVRTHGFKGPTTLELAHDYLWRCHAVVPAAGELMVWNRSHYEDVLVPVAEGWIDTAETKRRYAHINDFERLLVETGTTIVKCMLHISKDEQKERLQERLKDPAKNWKFDLNDLKTRAKWSQYQEAYKTALSATSTDIAPWYVIPANSKRHRNLMVAELMIEVMQDMKLKPPPANPALDGLVIE